jgi:endoglucanase
MKTFCALLLLAASTAFAQPDSIRINQLGYYPKAPKIAVITGAAANTRFYLVGAEKHDTVYSGQTGEVLVSKNSSVKTTIADFSAMQVPGNFVLSVPSVGVSYPFIVKNNALSSLAVSSLKSFYYIRSNQPLDSKYAGQWARPAGHPDTAVLVHASAASVPRPEGTIIKTPGGWYDAGDYNKYIVNSGITMGTLMSAYEDYPAYFKTLKTNIPPVAGVPDLLNEILYNLRWMLTMQDPNDGGVYHKCTNAAFDSMVMPGVTKLPRYVVQKGTCAALDFAAVMAQASRIFAAYKKQLPGLSDSCLKAAVAAWDWAIKNPAVEYNQTSINRMNFKPPVTTGEYGDKKFVDEWFWASAEMYITTRDENYYKLVSRSITTPYSLPSWNNVFALGMYSLLRFEKQLPAAHANDFTAFRTTVMQTASEYLKAIPASAFRTVIGMNKSDFVWGSNSVAANQGILLLQAYNISKKREYLDAALSNADYIAGRNATGYCFVTGIGSKPTMNPHHRPSVADGIIPPVPGLLAGGPNPGRQDKCEYLYIEPETAYTDQSCSYASNEIAINWNAPLVYLVNVIEALQAEAGYVAK